MKREFLKGLGFDDETINTIMAEYGKSTEALRNQIVNLEEDIKGKDAIILNNSANFDNRVNTEVQKIKNGILIENAVNAKFKDVNPLLSKLLIGQIDKSKLSVDEAGSVVGLDEQYTSLADTYKELLKPVQPQAQVQEQTPTTPTPGAGGVPTGGSPGTTESLENLNYEDYCKAREKQEKGE